MTNWIPRHVKNVWPDRQKFVDLAAARHKKMGLVPGRLGTGTPPLTVTSIKLLDESSSTDHVGQSITQTLSVEYYGDWDVVYIQANASTLGLPWYGDYAVGASALIYCSHGSVETPRRRARPCSHTRPRSPRSRPSDWT